MFICSYHFMVSPLSLIFNRSISRASVVLRRTMVPKHTRNYQDAIEALNNLQTNAQYLKNAVIKPKAGTNIPEITKFLKRTGVLIEKLDKLSVIHVAGTNGKGTTCAYCESILRNHGYKTGFYSSPHLLDVRERIRIDGKPISKIEFASHFWRIYDMLDAQKTDPADMPLYFRYLTIMAFHIFIEHSVDVAIVEVGIGGEYDCTNVIRNTVVAGITPLDLDHTPLLGHSIESIAWNKSGIMKEGSIAFTAEQSDRAMKVLLERSLEKHDILYVLINRRYVLDVINNKNKSRREFSLEIAKKSIEETHWPGRYEIKQLRNIRFFLDGAHTIESMIVCANWFKEKTINSNREKALIFNLTGDRNPDVFFKELCKLAFDIVIFTPNVGSENDTAEYKIKWLEIEDDGRKAADIQIFPSVSKAINFLDNGNEYDVLITGSIHLIGSALSVLDPTLGGALSG
ncbi:hypothetical protein NQ314_015663 [Rhamnusium bicolor]|uniref:tetrahydrofolate synthase n=1 Tax=Rhamnusium bicolor TaxID=1586634 RepID=A0AAV8WXV6_9CUCU|nr:hypothetical protein NQ314_015663 [Rhamnusium bicolor]